jgi:hypothetical protein
MEDFIEVAEETASSSSEVKAGFLKGNFIAVLIFVINILFFVGFYYGVLKTQLEAKPDEKRVREIVREEITNKFSITDGEVLKSQFQNLNDKLDKVMDLVEQHIMGRK